MSEDERLLKEAKKLPWEERLTHKSWKVRNDANVDLAAVCDSISDPKDPRLKEFGPLFKKTVSDSNAPVQEKALEALIAYLRAADADVARYAKEICDATVSKCLVGRPKTVEKAQATLLLWVELEANEVFLDAMEKAVKNKVAKAVVPAIDVMFQVVSEFGTRVVPPKRILKMLPELFDHQDQNVRASAKGLTIELCRWIGKDTVKSILFEKMRDTMKKELEGELASVTGVARPSRKIRSEQEKELEYEVAAETACTGTVDDGAASGPHEIDEYDLVDPVEILGPLEKSGFWEGVKAAKWSERRDAVTELTKLASAKKIAPGDFTEIYRCLKKLITDVNIAVAVEAVLAAGNLARGLRKDFSSGSRLLLPVLLDKLKEKKPVMVEALTQTLQAMHQGGSVSLIDVLEDVKAATKNKVPSVRSLTLNWVAFCIENSSKPTVLKLHKDYVAILMESLNDGTPEVRDAAFTALAAIAKLVGMKPLERSLEKLDDVRKKKLTELIGMCTIGPASNSVPGMTTAISGCTPSEFNETGIVKRSAASMLSGKKLVPQTMQAVKKDALGKQGASKKVNGGGSQYKTSPSDLVEDIQPADMSLEEIEEKVSTFLQGDVLTNLKSAVWKERLEGMVLLKDAVEGLTEVDRNTELLVHLLSTLPGWAEKNIQVQQKMVEVITDLAGRSSVFTKRCVVLCIAGVVERVSDIKTRLQAVKCLSTFCEAVGPNFVLERIYKIAKEHKNPKILSEGILWMVTAIEDFGVSHIRLKDLIDFCKDVGLQSSTAATRNATIKLIGVLHKFVGPDIKTFLNDVKPALQTALDAEYEKNPCEGMLIAPKRIVRASDLGAAVGGDSLPREDISANLTPTLLKNLSSSDWKVRQESLEAINQIIEEANRRIQPTGTGEMFVALKARLYDSNKNLVMMTLTTLGNLVTAMGAAVEKSSKGILLDVLKCLGDNKKQMRETVLKTLDSWIMILHLEKVLPYIVSALVDTKICADGRKDLVEWFTRQLANVNDNPEVAQLMKPLASALQEKSSDLRKAAELCIVEVMRVGGTENAIKVARDLQGSALVVVQPFFDKQWSPEISDLFGCTKGTVGMNGTNKTVKSITNGGCDRPSSRPGAAGSRGVSSRSILTKASKQAAASAAQDAAVQGQALFNLKESNKEEREKKISRKVKFEEPRPEQIQEIELEMVRYLREDLHRRLLSSDFKKQVDGLDILQKAIPLHIKDVAEILDVLLKWSVLRFCESNTTALLKVLEFLPDLVTALKNEGMTLTEYEAYIFIPCLVEKAGHNIEKVREKMRELTKLVCSIYPAPKVFNFILEGLRSKNNRTKIECTDQIGIMIEQHGIEIISATKALQSVAALTAERDGDLRKAALQSLSVAYKILGEDIWRYVGRLSDAQKSMLDDKFKWKAREMEKRKEGKPGETRASPRRYVRDNGLDDAEQSGDAISRPVSLTTMLPSGRIGNGLLDSAAQYNIHVNNMTSLNGPLDWGEALDMIEFGATPEQAVEGMKLICHELSQIAGDVDNSALDDLIKDADRLVSNLAKKVATIFDLGVHGSSSRSCKYVLNTLMQTFQLKKLSQGVKEDTLSKLIRELLLWLLDERVPVMDDGSQLLKALNVLMLKILENADRTSAFVVLILLLRPLDPSQWRNPTSEEAVSLGSQKFSDLVVKCLIKLTKVLGSTILEVDLDRLLQSIHEYLQELGMEELRRRAGADDKPLRMVKTVLHELVKLCGTSIKGHLSMVPIDMDPQPIILAYIDLNLQTLAAARILAPAGTGGQCHWLESAAKVAAASVTTHSTDAQLKQELAAVFKKIGDKQTCSTGLYELYRITQLYPQIDIFSQLQNASEAFRTYIRNGLAQMEKNAAAGRTPGSIPVATPPPVSSPSYPSPKLAPLSPLNTKVQSTKPEKPSPLITTAHQENIEIPNDIVSSTSSLGDGKTELCKSVPVTEVEAKAGSASSLGTLDAIRERMKNIQAAAAGNMGVPNSLSHGSFPTLSYSFTPQIMEPDVKKVNPQAEGSPPPVDERALSGLQARMERLKSGGTLENMA